MSAKLKNLLLFFMFLSGFSKANLSGDMGEIYKLIEAHFQFPENMRHLSPLNGVIALRTGILANVRFYGVYGSQQSAYWCHRQITHPAPPHQSKAHIDCPQDYTTSIIQHLFPSPLGGSLIPSGVQSDLFYRASINDILRILQHYHEGNLTIETFTLGKKSENLMKKSWNKPGSTYFPNKTFEEYYDDARNRYLEMFQMAKQEAQYYPPHIVESALLALAVKKAKQASDFLDFTKAFFNVEVSISKSKKNELKKQLKTKYAAFKSQYVKNDKLSTLGVEYLKQNKEDLVFYLIAKDFYDVWHPFMLDVKKANFGEVKGFPDCGETSLRNFFNVLLANKDTRTFDVKKLQRAFPSVRPSLVNFYTQHQPDYDLLSNDQLRHAWAEVVSGVPGVIYNDGGNTCNIKSTGLSNILAVLRYLLGISDEHQTPEAQLNQILNAFSEEGVVWSWQNELGDQKVLGEHLDLSILLNRVPIFDWVIKNGNFQFNTLFKTGNWLAREVKGQVPVMEALQALDPITQEQLVPYVFSSFEITSRSKLDEKLNLHQLSNTLLYSFEKFETSKIFPVLKSTFDAGLSLHEKIVTKWLLDFMQEEPLCVIKILEIYLAHPNVLSLDVLDLMNKTIQEHTSSSLLSSAIRTKNIKVVEYVLDQLPAQWWNKLRFARHPLLLAMSTKKAPIVNLLLDRAIELTHGKASKKGTGACGGLVCSAIEYPVSSSMIDILIDRAPWLFEGALAHVEDTGNLLVWAVKCKSEQIVQLLLQKCLWFLKEELEKDATGETLIKLASGNKAIESILRKAISEFNLAL